MPKPKKIPQRQCVGCRTMRDKRDLLRIVKAPDGTISLDTTGKKSGRGGLRPGPAGNPGAAPERKPHAAPRGFKAVRGNTGFSRLRQVGPAFERSGKCIVMGKDMA